MTGLALASALLFAGKNMTKIRTGQAPAALTRDPLEGSTKALERQRRAYGVVVHGDVAGVEVHRRNLTDWLEWMGMIDAGATAKLDRYVGYCEPYFNSHDALDKDKDLQVKVQDVARSVVQAVKPLRAGGLSQPDQRVKSPRTK